MSLDRLAESARAGVPEWHDERARRVLASMMVRRERRTARGKLARRSMAAASAAAFVVFVLLRGGSAPAGASTASETIDPSPAAMLAAHDGPERHGDGGYARD